MANKKVSQLSSKPSVLVTDLFPIADPSTGQLYKTTISDLGTAIGSGVSSVNSLVGAVVLDTDDIQELVSPTNKWFTDTRARAAISAGTGISYNSGTGVITNAVTSGQIITALGYTPANAATYLQLAGGTMTGAIVGTTATFTNSGSGIGLGVTLSGSTGDGIKITHSAGRAFNIQSSGSGYGVLINNETASTSAPFTIQKQGANKITFSDLGAAVFASGLTAETLDLSNTTAGNALRINHTDTSYHAVSITATGGSALYATGSVTVVGTLTATGVLTAQSGLANGAGQSFTLPSSTGTLALTSQLSAYLPLSGGTLTGALSGTSATFSSSVTAQAIYATDATGSAILTTNGGGEGILSVNTANPLRVLINGGEKVRVTSAGNVGIGTTSPTFPLEVYSTVSDAMKITTTQSNADLWFKDSGTTAGNNRIRSNSNALQIISGGNLTAHFGSGGAVFIGATSALAYTATAKLNVQQSDNAPAIIIANSNLSSTNPTLSIGTAKYTTLSSLVHIQCTSGNSSGDQFVDLQFYVRGDGVIYARNPIVQVITSDVNLKTNIVDYDKGLNEILKMKPRYFNYKDNLNQKMAGFIAQEMEQAVIGSMVDSKVKGYKSYEMDWNPIFVKAIQEEDAKIVALQNKVTELETKIKTLENK